MYVHLPTDTQVGASRRNVLVSEQTVLKQPVTADTNSSVTLQLLCNWNLLCCC